MTARTCRTHTVATAFVIEVPQRVRERLEVVVMLTRIQMHKAAVVPSRERWILSNGWVTGSAWGRRKGWTGGARKGQSGAGPRTPRFRGAKHSLRGRWGRGTVAG